MNVLAFDTCFGACSVAVGRGLEGAQPSIVDLSEPMLSGHAERLLPMISDVMTKSGLSFADLDRIAVTTGPGTFTGTRTGIAAARALALATDCATVGLSSLAVMAAACPLGPGNDLSPLAIVVDARRGEVYLQIFKDGAPLSEPEIVMIETAARSGPEGPIVFAGSGAAAVAEAARIQGRQATAIEPDLLPRAADMLAMALRARPSDAPLRPLYLRPPDAKPQTANILTRAGQ